MDQVCHPQEKKTGFGLLQSMFKKPNWMGKMITIGGTWNFIFTPKVGEKKDVCKFKM